MDPRASRLPFRDVPPDSVLETAGTDWAGKATCFLLAGNAQLCGRHVGWRFLLPLLSPDKLLWKPEGSRTCCLGSGWGQVAACLASLSPHGAHSRR